MESMMTDREKLEYLTYLAYDIGRLLKKIL